MLSFDSVEYAPSLLDRSSLTAFAERGAHLFSSPGRWIYQELNWGGKVNIIHCNNGELTIESSSPKSEGAQKAFRIAMGVLFFLPATFAAIILNFMARQNREVFLKQKFVHETLSFEEKTELKELIGKRQQLANQKQGCEPVTCSLCSIICLLYFIAFKDKKKI